MPNSSQQNAFNGAQSTGVGVLRDALGNTIATGMTLPLFTYALLRNGGGEASVGRIYAANTIGAIVGVFATVHFLLPMLGLKLAMRLAMLRARAGKEDEARSLYERALALYTPADRTRIRQELGPMFNAPAKTPPDVAPDDAAQ